MTRLTEAQLEILRTRPQSSKLYLSIFQPRTVFQARVNNASATTGDRQITFDSVTSGAYTHIRDGMTMFVGTSLGASDVGKIRVRSATSTIITVSENNNIAWADNLYLTVIDFYELWSVFPRIIQDPANEENVIFYKDYDVAYSNQNSILGTFVNMGSHRAALLDPASNQARIYYTASGTVNLVDSAMTYNWFFEGATVTGSTAATPGYITYNTPGHYVTRLTVTAANGASDVSYRYVSIYNQANPPVQQWQLESLQGSRSEGGYSASIKVFENVPIAENSVVVIFGENYYGDSKISLGGNQLNGQDIFFVGYIDAASIERDYRHSEVSFEALSITGIMKKTSGFSVSVESVVTPATWWQLLDMDTRRALYHYLRWHTTAMKIADFQFVGDDWKIQFFDSERVSMYDALDNHMKNTLIGQVVADRQGKVWMEVEAQAYSNPTGSFSSTVMQITNRDWRDSPTIEDALSDRMAFIEYGGIAYSGVTTGTFAALLASAPGEAPGFYGSVNAQQGLALQSQEQLNLLVGNIYANANARYPSTNMDMAINAQNIDIAPQESFRLIVNPGDTVRNVSIDGLYIPQSISWNYEPKNFTLLPNVEMRRIVNGKAGQTIIIPPLEDIGAGWSPSSFSFPPLPDIFSPVLPENGDTAPAKVIVHDVGYGLITTNTFNTPTPQWFQCNGGLTQAQYQAVNKLVVCPNGTIYIAGAGNGSADFIAWSPAAGSPFTIISSGTDLESFYDSGSPSPTVEVFDIQCDRSKPESLALVLQRNGGNAKLYIGSRTTWTFKQTLANFSGDEGNISYGGVGAAARWVLSASLFPPAAHYWVLSPDLSTTVSEGVIGSGYLVHYRHVRGGFTDKTFHWIGNGGGTAAGEEIVLASGNMTTQFKVDNNDFNEFAAFEVDDTATFLVGKSNPSSGNYTYKKSSDGGYSWSLVANLPVAGSRACVCNVHGFTSKWIACGAFVWYSGDFFNSYPVDKRGNILTVAPVLDINIVRAIG